MRYLCLLLLLASCSGTGHDPATSPIRSPEGLEPSNAREGNPARAASGQISVGEPSESTPVLASSRPPLPIRTFIAAPVPTAVSAGTPRPLGGHATGHRVGSASWCAPTPRYCHGWGPPALVAAVASFRYGDRPYRVRVIGVHGTVTVTVVSFGELPKGRIIDVSPAAFRIVCGPLSMGVCAVRVEGLR